MGKASKRASLKPQGGCIFCSGFGLSKEHVWPAWLQKVLPKNFQRREHQVGIGLRAFTQVGFDESSERGRLANVGDPLTQQLYVVCKRCNNGWMSELQTEAKQILISLIMGDWPILDKQAQATIASWVTMFTMVAEFAHPQTVAIPLSQREQFRETRVPLPDWRIWIAPFDGRAWNKKFHHVGMGLFEFPEPDRVPPCNVQITTAAIGKLLFQSFRFDAAIADFQLTSFYQSSLNWRVTEVSVEDYRQSPPLYVPVASSKRPGSRFRSRPSFGG
jgi:hypothetical protein